MTSGTAVGAVSPQSPALSYLGISGLQTPGTCRWGQVSTRWRSKPGSRVPRTRRVKAPCARTVTARGLANFLSHATFTSAPCPIASNPPTLGGFGPLASRGMVMPLSFPHPNASAGAGNGPSPGGVWQRGSVPGAAPGLGVSGMQPP